MRRRRRLRDASTQGELTLAALIDVLVNILIFLLHLYGAAPGEGAGAALELAESTATNPVAPSVVVVVSEERVAVGGRLVGPLEELSDDTSALKAVLREEWDKALADDAATPDLDPPPELVLEIDRRVPWTSLRPVLTAAASVGFVDLRFVVTTVSESPTP